MVFGALAVAGILKSKWTWFVAALLAAFIGGFFMGRQSAHKAEIKETVKEVVRYVGRKEEVRDRYRRLPRDVDGVLSGRASSHSRSPIPPDERSKN